ncbi:FadR/GntR family transcriptional regulator [Streptomyces sp. NBC_01262]|uniref:FadR/GntR family transcriptional regulator n=1 Tax=Streptomyces sp. NBC_01262 TaxID=2903803 RepID=UPI002E33C85E|nr:FadR/GntR family transcriptional regulator [Streptomyces sp. NBC_01262]
MSLTDKAIARIRELIQTGELPAGSKLPPEQQLAAELGLSRNLMREAVKSLAVARVLEIRRGDGTYVTSLQPGLLLEGLGGAVELLQGNAGTLLDLMEVRRLFEPVATALAATRIREPDLTEVKRHLDAMREARDDVELLNQHDAAFHRAVIAATGNETLLTLLEGISGRTMRARIWRGLVDADAADRTLAEHESIYKALVARDAPLAQAAALLHVSSTEGWLRVHLESEDAEVPQDSTRGAPGDSAMVTSSVAKP